jgi:polysaccharide export outer membrane protein
MAQVPSGAEGGATTPSQPAPPSAIVLPSYRVNPGDLLDISVFQKPELSKQIRVPPDGKLYLPFVGELSVAGLTLAEIKERLTTGFAKQLSNPQVSVAILQRKLNEVSVLGAVKLPGKRTLGDNWRILDLIADSGGLAVSRPEWVSATLVRGGGIEAIPVDLAKLITTGEKSLNLELTSGDVLLIREVDATKVSLQVLGDVVKPGSVIVPEDGSFASVITSVGGFKPRAALANATLIRGGKTRTIDLRQVLATGKVIDKEDGQEIKAEAGDTVIVAENKLLYSVIGAVNSPGVMEYPDGGQVTVLTALSLAGGANAGADLKNALLIRPVAGSDPQIKPINLENILKNKLTAKPSGKDSKDTDKDIIDVTLLPGDMLYVAPNTGRRRSFGENVRDALAVLPIINLISR